MPPSKPQKYKKESDKKPDKKPVNITASVPIANTVSSGWNSQLDIRMRPDLPTIPTPSMPTLDLKRKVASNAWLTDPYTKALYDTPMTLEYFDSPTGSNPDGALGAYEPGANRIWVYRNGTEEQNAHTALHEFAHSVAPDVSDPKEWNKNFIRDLTEEKNKGSDQAQRVLEEWDYVKGVYPPDQMAGELYARLASYTPNYIGYPDSHLSSEFINNYYPGYYKWSK